MYLLDTNVLSELRQPRKASPKLLAWASVQPASDQYISAITILELELGVSQKERRDPAQGAILRTWLDRSVLPQFAGRILALDHLVAIRCARLHVPNPKPERDAMIAATALVHGMTVVTRNTADFIGSGVAVINPWL